MAHKPQQQAGDGLDLNGRYSGLLTWQLAWLSSQGRSQQVAAGDFKSQK